MAINVSQTLAEIEKLETSLASTERKINDRVTSLLEVCRRPCIQAAEEYSFSHSYKILSDDVRIGFSLEPPYQICLRVQLKTKTGYEPDEQLSFEDVQKITKELKPILDKKLEEAGLPFVLGRLEVPTHYYIK